jgi:hypothetical protein
VNTKGSIYELFTRRKLGLRKRGSLSPVVDDLNKMEKFGLKALLGRLAAILVSVADSGR